jgi:EAL domain-containing protein (putative c-di-GMP-specific phosphodiesterase class I)
MERVDEAIAILTQIKSLGIGVALDDFGIGHSSLSLLGSLPVDKLKIDQSFVQQLGRDLASLAITQAIITLGQTLHLILVGEGVDSGSTLDCLRNSGCQQAQGFFISQPLPADDFARWRQLH